MKFAWTSVEVPSEDDEIGSRARVSRVDGHQIDELGQLVRLADPVDRVRVTHFLPLVVLRVHLHPTAAAVWPSQSMTKPSTSSPGESDICRANAKVRRSLRRETAAATAVAAATQRRQLQHTFSPFPFLSSHAHATDLPSSAHLTSRGISKEIPGTRIEKANTAKANCSRTQDSRVCKTGEVGGPSGQCGRKRRLCRRTSRHGVA